jgi:hypothetical protein
VAAAREADEERDDGEQQRQGAPEHNVEHGLRRQPQLVVELPQHVRGRPARGDPRVGVEGGEDHQCREPDDARTAQQDSQEHLAVSDLTEPQPVGIEAEQRRPHKEEQGNDQDDGDTARTNHDREPALNGVEEPLRDGRP